MNEALAALRAWESFYVIVGSSGGALIGLQFVVITLIAERRGLANAGSLSAFGTPCGVVIRRALSQSDYKPVWQDWVWYSVMPCCIYAVVTVGAVILATDERDALFVVGLAALALLLVGIHNAWDSVTHIVMSAAADER